MPILDLSIDELLSTTRAVRKRLEDAGMVPASGREDLARLIAEEDRKYEQLAAFANMRD